MFAFVYIKHLFILHRLISLLLFLYYCLMSASVCCMRVRETERQAETGGVSGSTQGQQSDAGPFTMSLAALQR